MAGCIQCPVFHLKSRTPAPLPDPTPFAALASGVTAPSDSTSRSIEWTQDLTGLLPSDNPDKVRYISVVLDKMTARVHASALRSKSEAVDHYVEVRSVWHEAPLTIHTDCGTEFLNTRYAAALRSTQTYHKTGAPYSPH
eukprot:GHVR01162187.1.p1 GENE.GHVR01162187.1~~GHVR01162187.1.p1  ORF type:complete len:139 (-),score=3.40 GHVR01162187.1:222-638(-)